MSFSNSVRRMIRSKAATAAILLAGAVGVPNGVQALEVNADRTVQTRSAPQITPYIVRSDYGGSVRNRLRDFQVLHASKRTVEIRGDVCMSSCTMLLGLRNTCVSPRTIFGFHGPARNGTPLSRSQFDQVSVIIARHYPVQLQSWYMNQARYSIRDVQTRTGAELIRIGAARPCDDVPSYQIAAQSLRPVARL